MPENGYIYDLLHLYCSAVLYSQNLHSKHKDEKHMYANTQKRYKSKNEILFSGAFVGGGNQG